jgi:hypothetical protein
LESRGAERKKSQEEQEKEKAKAKFLVSAKRSEANRKRIEAEHARHY